MYRPSGKYVKWNNNWDFELRLGRDRKNTDVPKTFSHWSYTLPTQQCPEPSVHGKKILICDVQGVTRGGISVFTDPQVHCAPEVDTFGKGDFGEEGIRAFFSTHRCGSTCRRLGLHTRKEKVLERTISKQKEELHKTGVIKVVIVGMLLLLLGASAVSYSWDLQGGAASKFHVEL